MSIHDAADAANDRHSERLADLPEQADPRDTDPALAAEWDKWLYDKLEDTMKRIVGSAENTEQEAWWA